MKHRDKRYREGTTKRTSTRRYLQVRSRVRSAEEEAESLRTNSSHWLEELEMAQDDNFWMQKNLSSLQREYNILLEMVLPHLLYNRTHHQRALQVIEQQRQHVSSNLSWIQEQYRSLTKRNLLIPRSSDLLRNCMAPKHDSAMLCPICPPGWKLFETSCYLMSEEARSWGESVPWCRVRGGYLAVINDMEEQNFLEGLVKDTTWIGLSDHQREGNWRWMDGTPYDSTTWFWHTDQPNNDGDEDCVTLSPVSKWNDDKCSEKYKSVCERRADRLTVMGGAVSN
ncbi:C-type lectin domain family 4 member M-like [Dendropsophus ebraccatus]|uniref:C-type lectin domain family 4 member M-like n=1 Tax=Dendropsophus ebraccatus TaxID=150705 RepID=UPI0038322F57